MICAASGAGRLNPALNTTIPASATGSIRPTAGENALRTQRTSHSRSAWIRMEGMENVLIATLGESPIVVTAMYDLLKKERGLVIDKIVVLHPDDREKKALISTA